MNYPRTERGGSRELYWPASTRTRTRTSTRTSTRTRTRQPPFWRDDGVLGRECIRKYDTITCGRQSAWAGRPSSERAGPPVDPARPVRSGNIVVTLNFASMNSTGKQEGIRWPSPRGAGPAKRSCWTERYSTNLVFPQHWSVVIGFMEHCSKI